MRLYEGLLNKLMEDNEVDDIYDLSKFYTISKDYLLAKANKENLGITAEQLEKALKSPDTDILNVEQDDPDLKNFNRAFRQFAVSASTGAGTAGVIKFTQNEDLISEITDGFDPIATADKDPEKMFNYVQSKITVNNADSNRNNWRSYCKTLVNGAKYLKSFGNIKAFRDYVNARNTDVRSRMKLGKEIENSIKGAGFAYAVDWLKELGGIQYSKPDTHILGVLYELGIIDFIDDKYEAFRQIDRIAKLCGVTPYQIDKVIWFNCSGNFYTIKDESGNGKKLITGKKDNSLRNKYIEFLKNNKDFRK